MRIKDCVIFGGTGFVGGYFLRHLLQHSTVDSIVIADLRPPSENPRFLGLQSDFRSGRVRYVEADLRRDLSAFPLPSRADLIVNLAALSRDTGFSDEEYFQTNVRGAENVCAWADHVCASRILFTSSSFSYGFCVEPKDESALQVPTTPYGVSKLVAEKIYLAWQAASPARRLLLVRPGIIFGEGEAGNVTRLLHALQRGYFFYGGNRQTLKPGGYVKELCHALM
jgi:nucleoside-diphosphate-sugar epimerase